jgi:hypothetical protein
LELRHGFVTKYSAHVRNTSKRRYLTSSIDSLGLGAGARLDAAGDRAVDVVVRDPALVVVLSRGDGNGGRLGTGERLSNIDGLLGLLVGTGALSLREESLDPGLVDEVESTGESSREEEVEEDTTDVSLRLVGRLKGVHTSGGQGSWWEPRR